jgi:hypothetical protein
MIKATTLPEVITHLDNIIEWSKKHQSRIGYFAALYRRMTIAVQHGIAASRFADGKRMEHLDVMFANRYLQAWEAYINKQKCTNAWCASFDACANNNLVVLQHLIIGINTHINLDLGIAAADACPGDKIYDLQKDFETINGVIASITQAVQDDLTEIWFPLKMLTKITNNRHEAVLNFSIDNARKASWANAVALAAVQGQARSNYINMIDNTVMKITQRVMNPGFVAGFILKPVRMMESKYVSKNIDFLNN